MLLDQGDLPGSSYICNKLNARGIVKRIDWSDRDLGKGRLCDIKGVLTSNLWRTPGSKWCWSEICSHLTVCYISGPIATRPVRMAQSSLVLAAQLGRGTAEYLAHKWAIFDLTSNALRSQTIGIKQWTEFWTMCWRSKLRWFAMCSTIILASAIHSPKVRSQGLRLTNPTEVLQAADCQGTDT